LLLPGATVLAPWIIWLPLHFSRLKQYGLDNTVIVSVGLFLCALLAGRVVAHLGSWWEAQINDRIISSKDPKHIENWYKYLRLAFVTEPVGVRYMRDVLVSLKFELNEGVALLITTIESWVIWYLDPNFDALRASVLSFVMLVIAAYLLFDSYHSSKILSKVREELIKGVKVVGKT